MNTNRPYQRVEVPGAYQRTETPSAYRPRARS
jgi:hypothetical protein